jgi:hypothetical protein
MHYILKVLYLLSITFWLGSVFFFSFISARSIFKILPRELAGDLISDMFTKYYLFSYIFGGIAILSTFISWIVGYTSSGAISTLKILILVIMLCLSVYAGTIIRPNVQELRIQLRSVAEDSPGFPELQNRFKTLHKYSVITNLVIFILGIAIVFITAYNYRV